MKKLSASSLFLLIALSLVDAKAFEPVAFECTYVLNNNQNGQLISYGTFAAAIDQTSEVPISNNVSNLRHFTISAKSEFRPTMPGGDGYDFVSLVAFNKNSKKEFYTTRGDGSIAFGDKKVLGFITINHEQSYYFKTKNGQISLGKDGLRDSLESHQFVCVSGDLNAAAKVIRENNSLIENKNIIVNEDSLQWTEVNTKCVQYGENDHGSYCEKYEEVSRNDVTFPICNLSN